MKFWPRRRRATEGIITALLGAVLTSGAAFSQSEARPADTSDTRSATELLEQFSSEVKDFSARFEQRVYDADGQLAEEPSSGTFSLLRPDRFRWDYETPDEYKLIADGKWVWEYDVVLEQATRDPMSEIEGSPWLLLSGEGKIGDNYSVRDFARIDGQRWIELVPVADQDDAFESAKIGFKDDLPIALELADSLGQTTRIDFTGVKVNSGLKARDFEFDPPRGVDVIGADD